MGSKSAKKKAKRAAEEEEVPQQEEDAAQDEEEDFDEAEGEDGGDQVTSGPQEGEGGEPLIGCVVVGW